jgi:Tol biopolymer transport system component
MRRGAGAALLITTVVTLGASTASATFPGGNGKIAFHAGLLYKGGRHITVIEPDGSGRQALTSGSRLDYEPSWSSDGTMIVFDAEEPGLTIQTMAADGTGRTVVYLAPRRVHILWRPTWSPDGEQIAFCAVAGRDWTSQIFVMDSDGSNLANISGPDHPDDCLPDWSPDGTKIAFTDTWSVAVMNADGSDRVTIGPHRSSWPTWSPDGTQIAFHRQTHHQSDIYVVGADGANLVRLTDTPRRREDQPAFSPDGLLVAYTKSRGPDVLDPNDIWIVSLADLATTRVTDSRRTSEFSPSWQPLPA